MKKSLLFTLIIIFVSFNAHAQLTVGRNGNVWIGPDSLFRALSPLTIGGNGNVSYALSIDQSLIGGAKINSGAGKNCLYLTGSNNGVNNAPVLRIVSNGTSAPTTKAFGIQCEAPVSNQGTTYGVCGLYVNVTGYSASKAASVYGSSTVATPMDYNGIYAGYFNGDVRATGTIYGTLLTPTASTGTISSLTVGNTSSTVRTELEEGILDRMSQVQLLRMVSDNDNSKNDKGGFQSGISDSYSKLDNYTAEDIERLTEEYDGTPSIQTRLSNTRYSLASDQLKDVFPELVYEDGDGNVSVNYIEMIPLLVQSVNELKKEVDTLKSENEELKSELYGADNMGKARTEVTGISSLTEKVDIISLSQNDPNPFSEQTTITLNIPEEIKAAAVFFYDMSGKQVGRRIVTERGQSSLSVTSSDFNEGMYLYSLIADGKVVATKKMILTK